jgi:MYXO-CTERM domain-containing protein
MARASYPLEEATMERLPMIRRAMMAAAMAATCALMAPASASAQAGTGASTGAATTTMNPATTTTTETTPVREDHDRDYGWIGLLGLAGLAGLRKKEPTVVHRDPAMRDASTTRDTMR